MMQTTERRVEVAGASVTTSDVAARPCEVLVAPGTGSTDGPDDDEVWCRVDAAASAARPRSVRRAAQSGRRYRLSDAQREWLQRFAAGVGRDVSRRADRSCRPARRVRTSVTRLRVATPLRRMSPGPMGLPLPALAESLPAQGAGSLPSVPMDDTLRTLVDRAVGGGKVPVGVALSLSSGITVAGTPAPHGKLLEAMQPVLVQQAGAAVENDSDPERAGNRWASTPSVQALWSSLGVPPGSDVITLVDVQTTRPGGLPVEVPVVRVHSEHIAAWWLISRAAAE
jgi:hypothetical protein